jgi:hydrogenase maturation protease
MLGDDGIGVRLVEDIRSRMAREEVTCMTSANGGLELLELLKDYQSAVIIDGMKNRDTLPGDIYFMDPEDYLETLHISNFHDADFRTALRLASRIGMRMPGRITIIGVGVEEDKVFSESLTTELEQKYKDILQLSLNAIEAELLQSSKKTINSQNNSKVT